MFSKSYSPQALSTTPELIFPVTGHVTKKMGYLYYNPLLKELRASSKDSALKQSNT